MRVCLSACERERESMFFVRRRMSPSLLLLSVFTFALHLTFMPVPPPLSLFPLADKDIPAEALSAM